jgi:hypothetical protein
MHCSCSLYTYSLPYLSFVQLVDGTLCDCAHKHTPAISIQIHKVLTVEQSSHRDVLQQEYLQMN